MNAFVANARVVLPIPRILGIVQSVLIARPSFQSERGPEEEARARRDFIWEMLERSPDAFSADTDVRDMMAMFPDRF